MKKYIVTRLGLDMDSKNHNINNIHQYDNPNYMNDIITLLLNFTYHSVKNQTCKDIYWIFYTGMRFNDTHKNLIDDVILDIPIQFIKDIEYKNIKKPWENNEDKIIFRLDSDDFMHPILIEEVEKELLKHYNRDNIVICHPTYGYKIYENFKLSYCEYEKIALGMGVITNKDNISVLHDHTKLKEVYEKICGNKVEILEKNINTDKRLYMYNRHKNSHSISIDKKENLFYNDDILKEFGVIDTIQYEHFKRKQ